MHSQIYLFQADVVVGNPCCNSANCDRQMLDYDLITRSVDGHDNWEREGRVRTRQAL